VVLKLQPKTKRMRNYLMMVLLNDAGFPIPENMAKNRRVEIYINKF
jgi:hypothetical protein